MHRAGQRCFELLALIGSPQLLFFFITKLRETNRTQHITIIFNVNQILYPNQLFYYFHEYYFVLQQNYKNETKTQHVRNYYLIKFNI